MHEFVNARSKVSPLRCRRVRPGRLRRAQPRGKCWIARSWSVRKTITFIPASDLRPLRRATAARGRAAAPVSKAPPATAADLSSSLRVSPDARSAGSRSPSPLSVAFAIPATTSGDAPPRATERPTLPDDFRQVGDQPVGVDGRRTVGQVAAGRMR
jgi:hypothetical protein